LASVVQRLLDEAETLYASAESGIARLPLDCRTGIAAARRIYAAIGTEVAAAGYDSITSRAHVSGRRKLSLALRAAADMFLLRPGALPANLFLLQDAAQEPVTQPKAIDKLLTMFERLERAQHGLAQEQTGSLA
jgi:phytoene synthase